MIKYLNHFRTKFKYGIIGYYIVTLIQVTLVLINYGFWSALLVYLMIEGIYGCIVGISYLIEKYITKTYR